KQDLDDQLVFRAINVTRPREVNVIPIEWDMHVTARWTSRYRPFDVKTPNVGMLHFNGGSASKTAYFKPAVSGAKTWMEKFEGTWGNARYYANIPWSWARFIAMGNRRPRSSGFQLKLVSHPAPPLQKISQNKVQFGRKKKTRLATEEKKNRMSFFGNNLSSLFGKNLSSQTVHLLYAADHDAMPGLDASVRSVLKHASERVVIHHVGTEPLKPAIFSDVEFRSLEDVDRTHNLTRFTNPHVSRQRSVSRLTSLANYVRFVMADMFPDAHEWENRVSEHIEEGETFNAGVMVVDLDRWRARNVTAKVEEWAASNANKMIYSYGSQPPLQLAIGDDFERMDTNWNVGGFGGNLNVTFPHCACLLHWNGARKYWLDDGRYKDLVDSTYAPCKSGLEKRREKNKKIHDQKKKKNESNVAALK
ncbi:hypothetical protein THAOC_24050, partial [Thalassiosira oceanica]